MTTANLVAEPPPGGLLSWMRAVSRPSLLAFGVGVLAVLSGLLTYATVTGFGPAAPTRQVIDGLLLLNLVLGATQIGRASCRERV